jgi:hypothetical protein
MHEGITPKDSSPRIAIELSHKTQKIYIHISLLIKKTLYEKNNKIARFPILHEN